MGGASKTKASRTKYCWIIVVTSLQRLFTRASTTFTMNIQKLRLKTWSVIFWTNCHWNKSKTSSRGLQKYYEETNHHSKLRSLQEVSRRDILLLSSRLLNLPMRSYFCWWRERLSETLCNGLGWLWRYFYRGRSRRTKSSWRIKNSACR